jgi:hypothetical protein
MKSGIGKSGIHIFVLILCLILIILVILSNVSNFKIEEKASGSISIKNTFTFNENFSEGVLNIQKWQITREGDFKESIVDVYDVDPSENVDFRLRLCMNTIGTRDDTVKFHGIRSVDKVDFREGKTISFDLDWNNQSNGCYLTGSLYLCPTATEGNPDNENNWLKFEYAGVPPGQNARSIISSKIDGNRKLLYADGWPEERTGRKIADQHLRIILDNGSFKILENGKELCTSSLYDLNFTSAYIYFQMSSHSNYPSREIYFDNIVIRKISEPS